MEVLKKIIIAAFIIAFVGGVVFAMLFFFTDIFEVEKYSPQDPREIHYYFNSLITLCRGIR